MHGPTRDHTEILRWAERHGASPAEIKPIVFDSTPSVLHFLFGKGAANDYLRPITWEDFFARFDLMEMVMIYDETPAFELFNIETMSTYETAS